MPAAEKPTKKAPAKKAAAKKKTPAKKTTAVKRATAPVTATKSTAKKASAKPAKRPPAEADVRDLPSAAAAALPTEDAVLLVAGVSVRFGGIQAVDTVDLSALPGSVTGLIGPNGAGKTTLFNVITGLERPTGGRVHVGGVDVSGLPPYRRARLGMARTFQRLEVFGSLTARGNILAAAEFRAKWAKGDDSDPRTVTEEIIDRIGLRPVANDRVDAMPTGLARLVELGRALATQPRLLLLDEPGSGLDHDESEALGTLLLDLAAGGMAILLVEHDVELVMRVCSRIHVLDFGRIIAVGTPAEIQKHPAVQHAYLGAEVEVAS